MVNFSQVNAYNPYTNFDTGINNNSGKMAVYTTQTYPNYSVLSNQKATVDQFQGSSNYFNKQQAANFKTEGNKHRLQGNYNEAIKQYNEALKYSPEYTDALYNLARTYRDVGNYDLAIKTFDKLLKISPNDFESRTILGEYFEELGSIDAALAEYNEVLRFQPKYDYARRNLQNARLKKISLTHPDRAKNIIKEAADNNLKKALELVQTKAPAYISQNLQGLNVEFGMTEQVNSYENLAQYENSNKKVMISNKLIFADPAVIATYIVHEAVHAGDKDPITSVREEQDAFREMTKFWIQNSNGLIDPDLTLAMNLYLNGPEKLDEKVADLYLKRDPNIRMTSPNHGELSRDGGFLSNLYDSLKSLVPAQGIYNAPNLTRNTIDTGFSYYQAPINPFMTNLYPIQQPIMHITPNMSMINNR